MIDREHFRFYRGCSMKGTFRPGDCLEFESPVRTAIRRGDVLIYRGKNPRGEVEECVHRVIRILPTGWITRGDNNPEADTIAVTPENLLGRVVRYKRRMRIRPVPCGTQGRLRARVLYVRTFLIKRIRTLARPAYRLLRWSGIVARFWSPRMRQVRVEGLHGYGIKFIHRRKTVAVWWPEESRFTCRKPYDLIFCGKEPFAEFFR